MFYCSRTHKPRMSKHLSPLGATAPHCFPVAVGCFVMPIPHMKTNPLSTEKCTTGWFFFNFVSYIFQPTYGWTRSPHPPLLSTHTFYSVCQDRLPYLHKDRRKVWGRRKGHWAHYPGCPWLSPVISSHPLASSLETHPCPLSFDYFFFP